jgi:hypothetical protein
MGWISVTMKLSEENFRQGVICVGEIFQGKIETTTPAKNYSLGTFIMPHSIFLSFHL